jgi:hypothetical protein
VPFLSFLAVASSASAQQYPITRVSVDSSGVPGNGPSAVNFETSPCSQDGRYVAFDSAASNLVPDDTNGFDDIFVHDRWTGATVRVSVDSNGVQGDADCEDVAISGDGRFVAFRSWSTNLVPNDTNSRSDVFVHDRDPDGNGVFDEGNGTTTRVSVSSAGVQATGQSREPALSDDGNLVVFTSSAGNLVSGDTNNSTDVFLHDMTTGETIRVSVSSSGKQGNIQSSLGSLSGDGTLVAFESSASNLVSGDNNNVSDVFVRDWVNGVTTRVSVSTSGTEGNGRSYGPPSLTTDGSLVTFHSEAKNLVSNDTNFVTDIFVRDRNAGTTTRESVDSSGGQANDYNNYPVFSGDGRYIVWESAATNLVPGDDNATRDVFLRDRTAGTTTVMSRNGVGVFGEFLSQKASINSDGTFVSFRSDASNLIADDTNAAADVFVYDLSVVEPSASWTSYGDGFPGTNGVPSLTASANPVFGATIDLEATNSSGQDTVGYVFVGIAAADAPTALGGTLLVDQSYVEIAAVPASGWVESDLIPQDLSLYGVHAFVQIVEADRGASKGWSFSSGLDLTLGL